MVPSVAIGVSPVQRCTVGFHLFLSPSWQSISENRMKKLWEGVTQSILKKGSFTVQAPCQSMPYHLCVLHDTTRRQLDSVHPILLCPRGCSVTVITFTPAG